MSNIAYTIYNDHDYTVTATDYPDKLWAWCDVRPSGVVNIHHGLNGNTIASPDEFYVELEDAIGHQADIEEAVAEARRIHEQSHPATLTITINQRGAAFRENPDETSRILRALAHSWKLTGIAPYVMDINGSRVGTITQTYESGLDRDLA